MQLRNASAGIVLAYAILSSQAEPTAPGLNAVRDVVEVSGVVGAPGPTNNSHGFPLRGQAGVSAAETNGDDVSIGSQALGAGDIARGQNQSTGHLDPAGAPTAEASSNVGGAAPDPPKSHNPFAPPGDASTTPDAGAYVPEPATMLLGMLGVFYLLRRRLP